MFCSKCGKEVKDDAVFCPGCGSPLNQNNNSSKKSEKSNNDKSSGGQTINFGIILISVVVLLIIIIIVVVIVLGLIYKTKVAQNGTDTIGSGGYFADEKPRVGKIIEFGSYEQDGNTSNGKEPIEWIVVSKEGDNSYLLLSLYILDAAYWSDGLEESGGALGTRGSLSYENSSIRTFLNEDFADEAFSEAEKSVIIPVSFREEEMSVGTDNATVKDYAFLIDGETLNTLSSQNTGVYELQKYNVQYNGAWISVPTQYAINRGVPAYTFDDVTNIISTNTNGLASTVVPRSELRSSTYYSPYALRTRGLQTLPFEDAVRFVSCAGEYKYGSINDYYGVRPAIYIDASK